LEFKLELKELLSEEINGLKVEVERLKETIDAVHVELVKILS
jgi:hypothetical protein